MKELLRDISNCTVCTPHLELGPRPVVSAHRESKIAIIGQAPGSIVHQSGIPWDDKSGENLRKWILAYFHIRLKEPSRMLLLWK